VKPAVLKSLLVGLVVSLAFAAWLLFRTKQVQHGIIFSSMIGVSSFAAHSIAGVISVMLIGATGATKTGAVLRISIALPMTIVAALLWVWAYSWARSFTTDAGVSRLPQSVEEVRFLSATDYRVASLSLYVGILGSLISSTLAFAHIRRDVAWFLGVILSLVALVVVVIAMVAS
jgi:hypothetical protein